MSTSGSFTPPGVPECAYAPRMTRAAALALRAASGLLENCVVVVTDGPTIGTAGNTSPTEIELNPVSPTEFGTTARVHTTFAASAWEGVYDIDLGTAGTITELRDDWGNTAKDIDADSPTVHTQVPWHLGGTAFRDNYFEDAVLPGWDTSVPVLTSGNKVIDSTVDITGKTGGAISQNEFIGTTVVSGAAFTSIIQSKIRAGSLNFGANAATGTVSLNRADLDQVTYTKDATATGNVTISNSSIDQSTFTQGAGSSGAITVNGSDVRESVFNVDAGSAKSIASSSSEVLGYAIRTQDTGAGNVTLSRSNATGRPTVGDSILIHGTTGTPSVSVSNSVIDGFSTAGAGQGSIDVNAPASGASIADSIVQNSRINIGPGAGAFQVANGSTFRSATVNANSATGGRLTIGGSTINQGTVNHAAAATDNLQIAGGEVINGGLVELLSGDRGLIVGNSRVSNGIIRQSTVNAANVPNINQVNDTTVEALGRIIFSETGPAGFFGSSVNRSIVRGNSLGAGVDGILTITGTSARVLVDAVKCEGIVTLTDVPEGALQAGTSFHDNRVGPGSVMTYTAGDNVAKQIRNNTVEDLSTLTLTGLTGSAGAGLADVFCGAVRGQSVMTVTGARVPGQPVRNFTVADGSTLNVDASGTVLQCQFRAGATLNTGAFRHSESVIDGAITKTATANNTFRLANKSFDDWL